LTAKNVFTLVINFLFNLPADSVRPPDVAVSKVENGEAVFEVDENYQGVQEPVSSQEPNAPLFDGMPVVL
jgi:hypothetical protein